MIRFAVIMRTACFPEISYRKILVKFSTYPDPLEWVLLLEDITTTESLNQSQAACRSIDHRIWLATLSHYVRGHIVIGKASSRVLTFLRAFVRDLDLRILFKPRLALENKGNLKHISLEVEKQESSSNGQKEKWRDSPSRRNHGSCVL